MRGSSIRPAVDPDVHAVLRASKTPVSVDSYKLGEPKSLECPHPECHATVLLDADPDTPGWEEMDHSSECPYRRD